MDLWIGDRGSAVASTVENILAENYHRCPKGFSDLLDSFKACDEEWTSRHGPVTASEARNWKNLPGEKLSPCQQAGFCTHTEDMKHVEVIKGRLGTFLKERVASVHKAVAILKLQPRKVCGNGERQELRRRIASGPGGRAGAQDPLEDE